MSVLNGAGTQVELVDGPHSLVFDINAFSEIEETYGDLTTMQEALRSKPATAVRFLLSIALEGDLSLKEAGALTRGVSLQSLVNALGVALNDAIGGEETDPLPPASVPAIQDSAAVAS